jgi:cytoskeletal protein CcmA (bactofilin family)
MVSCISAIVIFFQGRHMLRKTQDRKPAAGPGIGGPSHGGSHTKEARSMPDTSQKGRTTIGQHISINGDIRGEEDLVIEGSVKGIVELQKHHLIIGSMGQVDAEIKADNVTVSGKLTGNIMAAGKVQITKEADFTGEIRAKGISVEDGAYLKAVIEMEREPAPAAKPAVSSAAPGGPRPSPAPGPKPPDKTEAKPAAAAPGTKTG